MIEIRNVSYKYKDAEEYTLNNINFQIEEGKIIAIVGKNGSGKSTLGKLISGILKLKEGNIIIDGLKINDKTKKEEIRSKVGIVFQNPENQIIFNDIYDELAFALKDLSIEETNLRIQEALKQVDMLEVQNHELYTLSLGQKQRIMIAEILTRHPKYIILDEPTTMIDSMGKEKIYQIIKNLKKHGYTLICITNLADEILLADKTVILEEGKLVAQIDKKDLIDKAEVIKQHDIKLPTLLEIIYQLKEKGIALELEDYSITELVNKLSK